MEEASQFLHDLFDGKPAHVAVQLWVRSAKPVTWMLLDLDSLAELSERHSKRSDVYVACGLAPSGHPKAQRVRLKAHEVCGIPGVWADIDVNGGPDSKAGAAPDLDAARELAHSLLEPTIVVHSGYGIQAWWLWEDGPWMFPTRAEQDQAKRVIAGFQGALRAAARRLGWGLDATQDLARVMRLPGTFNHKGAEPMPVAVLARDGKRYSVAEISELGQGFAVSQQDHANGLASGEAIALEIRRGVPFDERVRELMQEEPEFLALWQMKRGAGAKRRDWSASEFEFSITNWLVRAGLEPQSICDVLVAWRDLHEPGDPRRKTRAERIATTIGKVIRTLEVEAHVEAVEVARENAVQTLDHISQGIEPANEAKTLGAFNQIIGGPEIARLRQYSRDPERARFVIELADGREVNLGSFDSISSQPSFRRAYGVITGYYPAAVGQGKWDKAVAGLLHAAVVEDDVEDSRSGQLRALLAEYLESHIGNDRDGACRSQSPFLDEACIYISIAHFTRWLRRVQGERIENADVAVQLRVLGFARKTITYNTLDGGRSSRSYFKAFQTVLAETTETPL